MADSPFANSTQSEFVRKRRFTEILNEPPAMLDSTLTFETNNNNNSSSSPASPIAPASPGSSQGDAGSPSGSGGGGGVFSPGGSLVPSSTSAWFAELSDETAESEQNLFQTLVSQLASTINTSGTDDASVGGGKGKGGGGGEGGPSSSFRSDDGDGNNNSTMRPDGSVSKPRLDAAAAQTRAILLETTQKMDEVAQHSGAGVESVDFPKQLKRIFKSVIWPEVESWEEEAVAARSQMQSTTEHPLLGPRSSSVRSSSVADGRGGSGGSGVDLNATGSSSNDADQATAVKRSGSRLSANSATAASRGGGGGGGGGSRRSSITPIPPAKLLQSSSSSRCCWLPTSYFGKEEIKHLWLDYGRCFATEAFESLRKTFDDDFDEDDDNDNDNDTNKNSSNTLLGGSYGSYGNLGRTASSKYASGFLLLDEEEEARLNATQKAERAARRKKAAEDAESKTKDAVKRLEKWKDISISWKSLTELCLLSGIDVTPTGGTGGVAAGDVDVDEMVDGDASRSPSTSQNLQLSFSSPAASSPASSPNSPSFGSQQQQLAASNRNALLANEKRRFTFLDVLQWICEDPDLQQWDKHAKLKIRLRANGCRALSSKTIDGLYGVFSRFDTDGSGELDRDEIAGLFALLSGSDKSHAEFSANTAAGDDQQQQQQQQQATGKKTSALSEEDLDLLMTEVDRDGSGSIDFEECLLLLGSSDQKLLQDDDENDGAVSGARGGKNNSSSKKALSGKMAALSIRDAGLDHKIMTAFRKFDRLRTGYVTVEQLGLVLEDLAGTHLSPEQRREVCEAAHTRGDGYIAYMAWNALWECARGETELKE